MASLDSLEIQINANAKDASDAIDALTRSLKLVGDALIPAADGLNSMADALDRVVAYRSDLSETVKALKGLSRTSNTLADFGKASTASNDAIAKAKTMSKALKEEYGITGKDAVAKLRESLVSLYSSAGNDAAIGKAINDIEKLIRAEGRFATKATETEQKVRDMVRNSRIYLSETDRAEFGDSLIKKMGILGSRNITTDAKDKANDVTSLLRQINSATNQFMGADQDDMHGIFDLETLNTTQAQLEALCRYLEQAGGKLVDFNTAAKQEPDTFNRLNETLNSLANSMGTTYKESIESLVSAMERAGTAVFERIPELQQMGAAMEEVANVSNPFAGIVEGLQQLESVHPSDALENLKYIKETISKIGGDAGANAANSLSLIANGIKSFEGVEIPNYGEQLTNFAGGLRALGSGNIVNAAQTLPFVAEGLRSLGNIPINTNVERVAQLAYALSRFGLANIRNAIVNMPQLAISLRDLINSLSQLPQVSDNTIRLIEAMSRLNVRSQSAGNGVDRLSGSLKRYSGHARNAQKSTKSLAAVIGKIYASYWLLFRGIQKLGKAITLASDLKEVQNVVDVTFGEMNDKMNEFAKNAVDTLGMSELTAKQIGSKYQAMGSAMGISKEMVKGTNDFVQAATHGYAEVADSMADISINLTKLAGDMASFYNVEYEEVAEKLQAVFTGQTRPLRAFGLDLTQATLKEWAMKNGMEVNMKTMTQAEKTLLRYQYVLANTTAAQGDFERTMGTWANQIRIAQERLKQLGIIIGQIAIYTFKPLVSSFNEAMKRIIELATATLNSLGKIFGWQIEWEDGGLLRDEEEDAEGIADDMGDAADNAKKFKNFLLGIDEINVLPDDKDKNKGSGDLGGLGGGLGDLEGGLKITPIEKGFESIYDTLYKLGKRIAEVMKDFLKNIDWDEIYKKARRFGRGLASFLNGYLADAELFYEKGRFIANGINTIANAIDAFFHEFNGWQLGVDIGSEINGFTENLDWAVIRSAAYEMAHDIAQTINAAFLTVDWKMVGSTIANGLNTAIDFLFTLADEINWKVIGQSIATGINSALKTFDFAKAGQTLNKWATGILDVVIQALGRVNWKLVGKKIGEFITNINVLEIAGKIGVVIWEAINAAVSGWSGLFESKPIVTSLATALAIPFSNKYFRKNFASVISKFAQYIGNTLSGDLVHVFDGSLFRGFGNAFSEALKEGTNVRNTLTGIRDGFNAISSSISKVTKVLGSVGIGLSEFFLVKDTIRDLDLGIASWTESLVKLVAEVGVASAAFTALLGVPTGIIFAGVTAGVAAFAGLNESMKKVAEADALSYLARDMGEASISLEEAAGRYGEFAQSMSGDLDNLHKKYEDLQGIKKSMGDMVGGYGLVIDAINNGNALSGGAMKELVGNIGNVRKAWEDYIDAQYDYLMLSAVNDYNFAKSQGTLTDEMQKQYYDRIDYLTKMRKMEKDQIGDIMDDLDRTQSMYLSVMDGSNIPTSVVSKVTADYREAMETVSDFMGETGYKEATDELKSTIEEFQNLTISFPVISMDQESKLIDSATLESAKSEIIGQIQTIEENRRKLLESIDQLKQERISMGYSEAAATESVQEYINAVDKASNELMSSVQYSLLDNFIALLADNKVNSAQAATALYNSVILPLNSEIKTGFEGKVEPYLAQQATDAIEAAMGEITYGKGGQIDFIDFFTFDSEKLNGFARSIRNVLGYTKKETDEAKKSTNELTEETEELGKGAVENYTRQQNAITSFQKTTVLANRGVVDLNAALVATKDSGKGIEEVSTGFKSIDDIIKQFSGQLPTTQSNFNALTTGMQTDISGIDVAFKKMYAETQNGGMKTVTWFKSVFAPMFGASYWNSILSGIPAAFTQAFTLAVNNAKSIWMNFAKWANANMKMNVSTSGEGKSKAVGLKFPQYEKGGFPEDGLFLANHSEMVGQFSNGKTAVANNEQIVEGIRQGVYEAVLSAMSASGGGSNVTVEITGDASDIFSAVVKENNRSIQRTGASPIRV